MLTMCFLPGTFFAALLTMPFFAEKDWMKRPSKFWEWVVVAIPSTLFAFAFYLYRQHRNEAREKSDVIEMTV